jgi:hypothetical protein
MPTRGLISHLDLNVSEPSRSLPFYALVLDYLDCNGPRNQRTAASGSSSFPAARRAGSKCGHPANLTCDFITSAMSP